VVSDETALVLDQQQGSAELGRRSRLALADRAGVAHGFLTLERLRRPKPAASA
jgi:hypothetical protein